MLGILVALVFAVSFSESWNTGHCCDRMLGGEKANIRDFPFLLLRPNGVKFDSVLILLTDASPYMKKAAEGLSLALERDKEENNSFQYWCAGAIISESWALAAARCFEGFPLDKLRFRSGSTCREKYGRIHKIEKAIAHPQFSEETFDYNIAVVKVSTPFTYSPLAQKIRMAKQTPSQGTSAVVAAWGFTHKLSGYSATLRKATVYITSNEKCKRHYPTMTAPRTLCAGLSHRNRNVCYGDRGAPLVTDTLVGIAAHSMACLTSKPGLYTDIATFRDWVLNIIYDEQ